MAQGLMVHLQSLVMGEKRISDENFKKMKYITGKLGKDAMITVMHELNKL